MIHGFLTACVCVWGGGQCPSVVQGSTVTTSLLYAIPAYKRFHQNVVLSDSVGEGGRTDLYQTVNLE